MNGTTTTVENLTQALTLYLRTDEGKQSETLNDGPLRRSESVSEAHWHWLQGWTAKDGSDQGPSEEWAEVAAAVVESWPTKDDSRTHRKVDRSLLHTLACEVTPSTQGFRENEDGVTSLQKLWIATNAWGAGTSDTRRPAATAKSLTPGTLNTLKHAARLILEGPDAFARAHKLHTQIRGFNEAYWTKFLWTLSLADNYTPQVQPLILDARLASTTWMIRGDGDWRDDRRRGDRYRSFCSTLTETANRLAKRGFDHIDSEKVEYLLFERHDDKSDFYHWLQRHLMHSLHTSEQGQR